MGTLDRLDYIRRKNMRKKIGVWILTIMMMATMIPQTAFVSAAETGEAGSGTSTDTRVADPSTMDNWKTYFGTEDSFSTTHAGHVWTDKTVLKEGSDLSYAKDSSTQNKNRTITLNSNDENNFLVALSAMASSEYKVGQSNKPTDTMIVLDLSSSMYSEGGKNTGNPATVTAMINAVNDTITKLQKLNPNNRVGVTAYYGGSTLEQATADSSTLMLPLGRYEHSSSKYLVVKKKSDGKIKSVNVNSNVYNTLTKKKATETTRDCTQIAGTYTQQGILSALDQFMSADTTVPETAEVNPGVARTPVMILMSDGKPTAATHLYTDGKVGATMGSNAERIRNDAESDFLTQLTAAYAREKMDAHYEKEKPLFYTLSLGENTVGSVPKVSYDVMDPCNSLKKYTPSSTISSYWDKLIKEGSVTIKYKNAYNADVAEPMQAGSAVVTTALIKKGETFPTNKSQMNYVDQAFEANDASKLADAFAEIYDQINLKSLYYPTLVGEDDDENLDGYVSFVDKIGKYMNVTDVKGILLGNSWYSGAEFAAAMDNDEFGTTTAPTDLGNNFVWAIQKRLGISDVKVARDLISEAASPDAGQLSYDNDTGAYSNYIGWYADSDGNYLSGGENNSGWWDGQNTDRPDWDTDNKVAYAVKSYAYLGEIDKAQGITESDMMYTVVQVRTDIETGEETVVFEVPAALIPVVQYKITLKENGKIDSPSMSGAEKPIRLVYEVALNDEVTEKTIYDSSVVNQEYIAANTDDEGYVSFYTNQYEVSGDTGWGMLNTYAYFNPSYENDNYYYQEDTQIYTDEKGTAYKGSTEPGENGTYYRALKTYEYKNGKASEAITYRQLSSEALKAAESLDKQPDANSTWYVPKGTVRMNKDYYNIEKNPNETETLGYADVAFYHEEQGVKEPVIGDTLGNNGRVSLKPVSGIKLTKNLAKDAKADENTEFTFVIQPADSSLTIDESKDYTAILVSKDGTETQKTVKFNNQKATVTLKADESIYITGLVDGKYQITENETAKYLLSSIEVNDIKITEDKATVNVSGNTLSDVEFTNADRGTGNLTITKNVEHSLGDSYVIPADVNSFEITVLLDGVAVAKGDEFNLIRRTGSGGTSTEETVTVDKNEDEDVKFIKFNISDKETVKISKLPEGTKATVTETAKTGFTASYIIGEGDSAKSECTVEIAKGSNDTVGITNTYKPEPVVAKFKLTGAKILQDDNEQILTDWAGKNFDIVLQKYVPAGDEGSWVDVKSESVTNSNQSFEFNVETSELDEVGRYAYQVIEKNFRQTIDGITYDDVTYEFSVVVTDGDMDGKLEASVESKSTYGEENNKFRFDEETGIWVNNEFDFTNVKTDGQTSQTVMIKKILENPSGSSAVSLAGYTFSLYECDSSYKITNPTAKLTSEATGDSGETSVSLEYKYSDIKDKLKNSEDGALTYYYKIKENASGITNMTDSAAEYNFAVKVSAVDGVDSGKITSDIITSGEGWSEYFAGSSQQEIAAVYKLANFTNKYSPAKATVSINAEKKISGRDLKTGEFSFSIDVLTEGAPVPARTTANNDADGNVNFGSIAFSKTGEYKYKIYENSTEEGNGVTIDEAVYTVSVKVSDETDADGKFTGKLKADMTIAKDNAVTDKIIFNNTYKPASTDITISGTKELTGLLLTEGRFGFTLAEADENGNVKEGGMVKNATNKADGTFAFDKITYKKAGAYCYVISENIPESSAPKYGIVYDEAKYLVTVKVTDNEKGSLVAEQQITKLAKSDDSDASGNTAAESIKFVNNYIPAEASAQINGTKDLDGAELKADQFSFTLYKADENWNKGEKVETVSNAKDGSFKFSELKFACDTTKLIAGKDYEEHYYYIIEEENASQTIDGVTYDSRTVGVEVTVTDNKTGNLSTELSYYDLSQPIYDGENAGGDSDRADGNTGNGAELIGYAALTEAAFHNSYEVSGEAEIYLDGTKYLEGRELKAEEFTFVLTDESGDIVQTAQNDAKGNFAFELKYDAEDVGNTYKYTVKEAAGALDGVKYDSKEYAVTVDVKDNGTGGVAAEVKVKKGLFATDDITFKNIYENPKGGDSKADGGETKTGDSSNMLPFAVVATVALAGIITLLIRRKKA